MEISVSFTWNKVILKLLSQDKEYDRIYYTTIDINKGYWDKNEDGNWYKISDDDTDNNWINNGHKMFLNYRRKRELFLWYGILDTMKYPFYAHFLTCEKAITLQESKRKDKLLKKLLKYVHKDNLVSRAMLRDTITLEELSEFKTTSTFRGSARYDGTSYCYPLSE